MSKKQKIDRKRQKLLHKRLELQKQKRLEKEIAKIQDSFVERTRPIRNDYPIKEENVS